MERPQTGLPELGQVSELLDLRFGSDVGELLDASLLEPLHRFLENGGKRFRGRLVVLSFCLAGEVAPEELSESRQRLCARGAQLLEHLHAGSLVVDDIEDGSELRRGQPTLHRRVGTPVALNAGNWLYFWPLDQVRDWGLDAEAECGVYRVCHRALLKAHFGQALDVGVPVDSLPPERMISSSLASLELKTGALTGLATALGGVLAGGRSDQVAALEDFGRRFGVALQMLDDLGNLLGRSAAPGDPKRHEDLRLRRPSAVWASLARFFPEQIPAFVEAVRRLPDETALARWLARHPLEQRAREEADNCLREAWDRLERGFGQGPRSGPALGELRELSRRLTTAYL